MISLSLFNPKSLESILMKKHLTFFAAFIVAASTQAATIGVNFLQSPTNHPNQHLAADTEAGIYPTTHWNNAFDNPTNSVAGTVGSLTNDLGTATTASITWSAGNTWGDAAANADATAGIGDAQLDRGYLDDNAPGVQWTVSSVPYSTYSVILYLCTGGDGGSYQPFTVNGTAYTAEGRKHNYEVPMWDPGNIIIVSGLSGDLTVSTPARAGTVRGSVGGFQIIEEVAGTKPDILTFTSSSTNVMSGETVTFSWLVKGADTLSIDQGVGVVTGSSTVDVVVNSTATYTLTAHNANGDTLATQTVTVRANPPVINAFSASKTVVPPGTTVVLSWDVDDATSLSLDQGIGDVTGETSKNVLIYSATTYTLSAINANGTTTASVEITIGEDDGQLAHYTFDVDGTATVGTDAILGSAASIDPTDPAMGAGALALSGVIDDQIQGTDGAVSGNNFDWSASDVRTVAFWMKATAGDHGDIYSTMISMGAGIGAGQRFDIRLDGDKLRLEVQGGGTTTTTTNITDGTWHHVAVVVPVDGAKVSDVLYYVDGTYIGNFASGTAINTGTGPLRMGDSYQGATRDFKGSLDDVRLYDKALTAEEIQDLLTGGGTPPVPVEDLTIMDSASGVILSWTGADGKTYGVETNANLSTGNWQPLVGALPGTGGLIMVTNTTDSAQTFYRVISE